MARYDCVNMGINTMTNTEIVASKTAFLTEQ